MFYFCFNSVHCSDHLWEVMIMAFPDSRVRVTESHSSLRATGSIPVEGSSRKMTGGPPIRAMPALSFRLLPPLHDHKKDFWLDRIEDGPVLWVLCGPSNGTASLHHHWPVAADQFVSMRLQQQGPEDVLHTAHNILLWYPSEPGVHTQSLPPCHVIQHSIKLGTVTDTLLHLQSRDKGLFSDEQDTEDRRLKQSRLLKPFICFVPS